MIRLDDDDEVANMIVEQLANDLTSVQDDF